MRKDLVVMRLVISVFLLALAVPSMGAQLLDSKDYTRLSKYGPYTIAVKIDNMSPENRTYYGSLPLFGNYTNGNVALISHIEAIQVTDQDGRVLSWVDASSILAKVLDLPVVSEPIIPGSYEFTNLKNGSHFLTPESFSMLLVGKIPIHMSQVRRVLYKAVILDAIALKEAKNVKAITITEGGLSTYAALASFGVVDASLSGGMGVYEQIRTISDTARALQHGSPTAAIAAKVSKRVGDSKLGQFSKGLGLLATSLEFASNYRDKQAVNAYLAEVANDLSLLISINDLRELIKNSPSHDPAMAQGIEDAIDELIKLSQSRFRQMATSGTHASIKAAPSLAALVGRSIATGGASLVIREFIELGVTLTEGTVDVLKISALVTLGEFMRGHLDVLTVGALVGITSATDISVRELKGLRRLISLEATARVYGFAWGERWSDANSIADFGKGIGLTIASLRASWSDQGVNKEDYLSQLRRRAEDYNEYMALMEQIPLSLKQIDDQCLYLEENQQDTQRLPSRCSHRGISQALLLLIDNSGSMKKNDPQYLRKVAVQKIIDIAPEGTKIGIIGFQNNASVIANPTQLDNYNGADRQQLRDSTDKIHHNGGTNIREALSLAAAQLQPGEITSIILLSDGEDKQWHGSPGNLPTDVTVHAIALSANADTQALRAVAQATGGRFDTAQSGRDLDRIFQTLFEQSTQQELNQFTQNSISPGENHMFSVDVEPGADAIYCKVDWPGSDIDLLLISPSGKRIDTAQAVNQGHGVERPTYDMIEIKHPEPGRWKIRVQAVDVDPNGETYTLRTSTSGDLRKAQWQVPTGTPAINDYTAIKIKMADTLWKQASVTVWDDQGQQLSRSDVATSVDGQVPLPVLNRAGMHRVQIVAQGITNEGHRVSRSFDQSIRFSKAVAQPKSKPQPVKPPQPVVERLRSMSLNAYLNQPQVAVSAGHQPSVALATATIKTQPDAKYEPPRRATTTTFNANQIFDALTVTNNGIDSRRINLDIQFEVNSARLSDTTREQLQQLGEALKRVGANTFEIAGHTDSSGSNSANLILSRMRAASVRTYLLDNFGLSTSKLAATGYGERFPRSGRAAQDPLNRRVEVVNHGKWISVSEIEAQASKKVRGEQRNTAPTPARQQMNKDKKPAAKKLQKLNDYF
ncbi:hypothetical protein A9Q89_03715 [Gammaproteobacteria bacterium 53_120_T64]|nr:hypothetical protein A9Q89_03715 [Gammaproteobacteria bacterium 53_120_T64]